jgi:hypothetical protein
MSHKYKFYYNNDCKLLILPYSYDEELDNLPEKIEIIIFSEEDDEELKSCFNKSVDNLPKTITKIIFGFGSSFNQPVNNLPPSLTHLTFGYGFNQSVDNLPTSLTHLTFGFRFNKPVDNLPNSITHLTFYYDGKFNKPLKILPNYLVCIKLNIKNNNNITLPKNCKKIFIDNDNYLINNLPEHIEKIYINFSSKNKIENLPSTLKEIVIKKKEYIDYIKIPFGTIVTVKNYYY